MRIFVALLAFLFLFTAAFAQSPQSCEKLAQVSLTNAKVTSAQSVAAGAFAPPSDSQRPPSAQHDALFKSLPGFCRVSITATPSSDSDIKIEVWLPGAGWNRRLQAYGNGGFAGEIEYRGLGEAITGGYAAASTNTGHSGSGTDASWAPGHPEKIIDFGYRAIHEMTVAAKAVVHSFYGSAPKHSYFAGCSNGGRQALMEAQRFPADYDGILAGAPANYWTHLLTAAVWNAQATTSDPASYIPPAKLPALAHAVIQACDASDGVLDGIVNDPRKCDFKPSTLQCNAADSDACLTAPQVAALNKLYEGAHDSQGHQIFPGFLPGAEEGGGGWGLWITGPEPGKSLLAVFGRGYFSNMLYEKPDWDFKSAKMDQIVADADKKSAPIFNATDPNLKPFTSRGGKLILYHGWNDAGISALNSVNYYSSVVKTLGEQQSAAAIRLYMEPGVQHCAGGVGPDNFGQLGSPAPDDPHRNAALALEQWVEQGTAPADIIAGKYDDESKLPTMTRPLCPYPQAAKYKGTGDPHAAASFTCAAPNERPQ
jgi:Tannase and feruloyl esterase